MGLSDLVYGVYERRLYQQTPPDKRPRHVGVILDGNRRWASEQGTSSSAGHRAIAPCEDSKGSLVPLDRLNQSSKFGTRPNRTGGRGRNGKDG